MDDLGKEYLKLVDCKPPWERYGITEKVYEDIIAPYKEIIHYLVEKHTGKVLLMTPEEILKEIQKNES